jgi:hypothetical protein
MASWSRSEKLAVVGIVLAAVSALAAVLVVPEFRSAFMDELPVEPRRVTYGYAPSDTLPLSQQPQQPAPSNPTPGVQPNIQRENPSVEPQIPQSDKSSAAPFTQQDTTIEMRGMRFTLRACSRSGSEVECTLSITNQQAERMMRFVATSNVYGVSYAFVGDGIKYLANRVTIGSRSSTSVMQETFLQDEPFSASIIFPDLPSGAATFSTLNLKFATSAYRSDWFDVRFRNIPIRR